MWSYASLTLRALVIFFVSLSSSVKAVAAHDQAALHDTPSSPPAPHSKNPDDHYSTGDLMPVTCLNRTLDTGEHITDAHGNLQYIPFPTCAETDAPLAFAFGTPQAHQTCTIPELPDELYHLLEFFVHSDVPLTCRVPTYPLLSPSSSSSSGGLGAGAEDSSGGGADAWTPLTIALHGTLQFSHLHLHTNINVLFHTTTTTSSSSSSGAEEDENEADSDKSTSKSKSKKSSKKSPSAADAAAATAAPPRLLASTAYSVRNLSRSAPREGAKVMRNEPLTLTFNVGWIDGAFVPGMAAGSAGSGSAPPSPLGVVEHRVGFSLLSFFACAASAGVGAMGMLVYERRNKRSIYSNGILGGNVGGGATAAGFFAAINNNINNINNTNTNTNTSNTGGSNGGGFTAARSSGYGGYGGYSSSSGISLSGSGGGKRD